MLAVKYVQSFLVPFIRPVVICLGVGTNWGDHTGSSPLAGYLNATAVRRSMCIVAGGGNEGNQRHHFYGSLATGMGGSGNYRDVEIRAGAGERGFFMELWGSMPDTLRVSIRSPGGEIVPETVPSLGQSVTYRFIFEDTQVSVHHLLVEESTGEQLIIMRFAAPTEGVWRIRVSAGGMIQNGKFHLWLPITRFLTGDTYFLEPDPYVTLTEPSNAENVITVSTYDSQNNSFYVGSGRGFTRNGRVKPDLAAPGVNIPVRRGTAEGSSMAAAITAGAAAQFMQWAILEEHRPFVTSKEVKNYLIRGAQRSPNLVYPDREWGYGRLDLEGTFEALAGGR